MSDDFADRCSPWFDPNHPMNKPPSRRMSIDELERILNTEEDQPIQIMPNGEVRYLDPERVDKPKVLTMRENLGGEYGAAGYCARCGMSWIGPHICVPADVVGAFRSAEDEPAPSLREAGGEGPHAESLISWLQTEIVRARSKDQDTRYLEAALDQAVEIEAPVLVISWPPGGRPTLEEVHGAEQPIRVDHEWTAGPISIRAIIASEEKAFEKIVRRYLGAPMLSHVIRR